MASSKPISNSAPAVPNDTCTLNIPPLLQNSLQPNPSEDSGRSAETGRPCSCGSFPSIVFFVKTTVKELGVFAEGLREIIAGRSSLSANEKLTGRVLWTGIFQDNRTGTEGALKGLKSRRRPLLIAEKGKFR